MQDVSRTALFSGAPFVPSKGPLPQLLARSGLGLPGTGGMEIGGLLNARHAAAAGVPFGQHLQHTMPIDPRSYSMGQAQGPPMNHHQQQHPLPSSNGLTYPSMHPAQPHDHMYSNHYNTREDSQEQTADDDVDSSHPKDEPAHKQFHCSTCPKGFARRSDLARHGESAAINA